MAVRARGALGAAAARAQRGRRGVGPDDAPEGHAAIDEATRAAGREPEDIVRALNVMALDGAPSGWADQLARIATELRFSTLLVGVPPDDPVSFTRRVGEDVAPRVRELIG